MRLRSALAAIPRGMLLIAAAYGLLRLGAFAGVGVRHFPDTISYVDVGKRSLLSMDFWAGERAWTIPLLYKLPTDGLRAWAQFLISVTCWLALAAMTARALGHPKLKLAGFAAVLLFSMSIWIVQWDAVLLSESLSLSLTAGVLALWLALLERPRWGVLAALLVVTLLWVSARDTNAYLLLVALAGVVLWLVRGRERAMAGVLAAGLVAIFVLSAASASTELAPRHRWLTPMLNVLGMRILPDEERTNYFAERGLPVSPLLRQQAGVQAGIFGPGGTGQSAIWTDPRLFPVLEWVRERGRSQYARYLLTHPYYTLAPLASKRDPLLSVEPRVGIEHNFPLAHYRPEQARTILPEPVDELIFPTDVQGLTFWLVLAALAAGVVLALTRAPPRPSWSVPLALFVSTPPHLLLIWHGDSAEVTRHAVVASVALRLAVVILALFALDAWLTRGSASKNVQPCAASAESAV